MLPPPGADGPMDLTVRREGAAVVLDIDGELDLDTVGALAAALDRAAKDDEGAGAVVLDMSGVVFADSTTVNVLLQARGALRDRMRVACPSAFVRRLLSVVGLEGTLRVYPSVSEALAAAGEAR